MRRMKTNVIIAALFCVCVILGSIGYVKGLEGEKSYTAPDLLLTQGQVGYDLCEGIEYDEDRYGLSVEDEGEFDINKPGSYTVAYALTPLDEVSGSDPMRRKMPGETGAPKETDAPKATSAPIDTGAPKNTAAPGETGVPKGTSAPVETGELKGTSAPVEADAPKGTSAPVETGEPKGTSAPVETGALKGTSAPVEADAPKGTSAPIETGAPKATSAPEEAGAPKGTSAPIETSAPKGTSAPIEADAPKTTSAPIDTGAPKDTASPKATSSPGETGSPEGDSAAKETGTSKDTAVSSAADTPKDTAAPKGTGAQKDTAPAQKEPSMPEDISASAEKAEEKEVFVKETAERTVKEKLFLMQKAPAPEKASPSDVELVSGQISFSRTIVVRGAVRYQDDRFDIDTVSDLLTGMDYDPDHYELTILDDGGFNSSRIDEYHIIYRLMNTDNGNIVADLERYIWITAPGVTFEAPELRLHLNQAGYELREGIAYDAETYALTAIDPDSIDTLAEGEQRAMFCMTAQVNSWGGGGYRRERPRRIRRKDQQSLPRRRRRRSSLERI